MPVSVLRRPAMFFSSYVRPAFSERDAAMYYAQHTPDEGSPSQTSYFMGSALYASPVPHDAAPPPLHLAGQAFAPMYAEPTHEAAPPAKRSRKDKAGAAAGRMQGACTRCKRLKVSLQPARGGSSSLTKTCR